MMTDTMGECPTCGVNMRLHDCTCDDMTQPPDARAALIDRIVDNIEGMAPHDRSDFYSRVSAALDESGLIVIDPAVARDMIWPWIDLLTYEHRKMALDGILAALASKGVHP